MNKKLTIPSMAFFALVMGLSTVVMAIPQAFADGECLRGTGLEPRTVDVFQFDQRLYERALRLDATGNNDGLVCATLPTPCEGDCTYSIRMMENRF